MNRLLLALALLATTLAGCTEDEPAAPVAVAPTTVELHGIVQDRDVVPIGGATVTLRDTNMSYTTGVDGRFVFGGLEDRFYLLDATAPDHDTVTLTHGPGESTEKLFVLTRIKFDPFYDTQAFQGLVECAAEYVIITPSCDTALEYVAEQGVPLPNGGSITADRSSFEVQVNPDWQTLVVDVVFDLGSQPGLEALRTVFSGIRDANELTHYDQFGRFQGAQSYTFRIEPGASYPDGVEPVNGNATHFRLDVYGQGHGWHALCDLTGDPSTCTLGVGAGIDVGFELFVTAFYVEPAPEGWSFQA